MSANDTIRVVFTGEGRCGKTSIMKRLLGMDFDPEERSTVRAEGNSLDVEWEGTSFHLEFSDTAGQEKYNAIVPIYYQKADIILLVYSIVDYESIESARNRFIKNIQDNNTTAKLILIGNKVDLQNGRKVEFDEGKDLADTIYAKFIESSACNGHNIDVLKDTITEIGYNILINHSSNNDKKLVKKDHNTECCK